MIENVRHIKKDILIQFQLFNLPLFYHQDAKHTRTYLKNGLA